MKGWSKMKKTYKIEVDCANCANKMEEAARQTAGVKDAVVNFMTLKMTVEFEEGEKPADVMPEVLKNWIYTRFSLHTTGHGQSGKSSVFLSCSWWYPSSCSEWWGIAGLHCHRQWRDCLCCSFWGLYLPPPYLQEIRQASTSVN